MRMLFVSLLLAMSLTAVCQDTIYHPKWPKVWPVWTQELEDDPMFRGMGFDPYPTITIEEISMEYDSIRDKTIVYISFAPEDNGIGARIDIQGGYVSMAFGNYRLPYDGYIKDRVKLSMGALYKNFSLGLTYHEWGEVKETIPLYKHNLRHLSFEAGGRVYLGKIVVAFRYDILRTEGTVDVGVCF